MVSYKEITKNEEILAFISKGIDTTSAIDAPMMCEIALAGSFKRICFM